MVSTLSARKYAWKPKGNFLCIRRPLFSKLTFESFFFAAGAHEQKDESQEHQQRCPGPEKQQGSKRCHLEAQIHRVAYDAKRCCSNQFRVNSELRAKAAAARKHPAQRNVPPLVARQPNEQYDGTDNIHAPTNVIVSGIRW